MRMNLFKKSSFLAAVAASMVLASCSSDENVIDNGVKEDAKTRVGLALAFPGTGATRAADSDATDDELKIDGITVFIFNSDGSAATGNGSTLGLSDFKDPVSNNVYEMKDASKITTTTGTKRVYVGINLPSSFGNITSETTLNATFATTVAELTNADGFAMFSTEVKVTKPLVTEDDATWAATNTITVDVERLIAKVTALKDENFSTTFTGGTFTDLDFALGQAGDGSMYRSIQRDSENGRLITPTAHTGMPALSTFKSLNAYGTALKAADSFYGMEHAGSVNLLRQEVTCVVFHTVFTPTTLTYWDDTDKDFKTEGWTTGGDATFYTIDGKYFNDVDHAAAYQKNNALTAPVRMYKNGNCYYYQFLAEDLTDADTYEFARNQYYKLTVAEIKGLGEPGDEVTGEPIITDPKEPVIETPTSLIVNIDVKPWDVRPIGGIVFE